MAAQPLAAMLPNVNAKAGARNARMPAPSKNSSKTPNGAKLVALAAIAEKHRTGARGGARKKMPEATAALSKNLPAADLG